MSAVSGSYAPAGQGWRLANCLVTVAHELAGVYGDQLTCLGTVGDISHQAEGMGSDHNPFVRDPHEPSIGIVRAIDFGGSDSLLMSIREHIWTLYAAQDPRVYEYGYSKGCSDNLINNWGLPFGVHVDTGDAGHLHISVTQVNGNHPSSSGYVPAIDSTATWGFASVDPSSGGNTPIGDDMFSAQQEADIANAASLILQLEAFGPNALSNAVKNAQDTRDHVLQAHQAINITSTQVLAVGAQIAALPAPGDGSTDLTPVLDAINALPAATVAAIKEAL